MSEENLGVIKVRVSHGGGAGAAAGEDVRVERDLAEGASNAEEAIQMFIAKYGHEIAFSNMLVGCKNSLRNFLSQATHGDDAVNADDAIAQCASWEPRMVGTRTRKDPMQIATAMLEGLTLEQQAEIAKLLRSKIKEARETTNSAG